MFRSALAVAALLAAGRTGAGISTSLVEIPNGLGPGFLTYDLVVHVSGEDHWTSTSLHGSVVRAKFYHHWGGGNTQPNPHYFPYFPELQWDTFITTPEGWPNTPTQGQPPGCAGLCTMTATQIDISYFDTPPNNGDGDWVVARISVEPLGPAWQVKLWGAQTTVKGQATLYPYSFTVPEPSGLLLLAASAGLAALRRMVRVLPEGF